MVNWFLVLPLGWLVAALVVGLFIGRGIRVAGGAEAECPLPRDLDNAPAACVAPGDTRGPAAAEFPDPATDAERPLEDDEPDHGRARERSLTAAR